MLQVGNMLNVLGDFDTNLLKAVVLSISSDQFPMPPPVSAHIWEYK